MPAMSNSGVRWAWLILLAAHVAAVFVLLPPGEILRRDPILGADHPAHAHRVHVYREALYAGGAPWGYDPAVSAGVVMRPTQDAGAKPQEILGACLPFASPGMVIRLFAFCVALLFPLGPILAARRLNFPAAAQVWVLAVLLIPAWLYQNFVGFFQWGLVAFAAAAYLCPLVLALFLNFLSNPRWSTYFRAVGSLALLAFLHILGPVIIAPVLLTYTFGARPLPRAWRSAALAAPLLILVANAFWFVPFVLDFVLTPAPPGREFTWYPTDLTYLSVGHLWSALSWKRVAALGGGIAFATYGLLALRQVAGTRAAAAIGMAAGLGLFLKFAGSFIPGVVLMQPSRFLLPTFAVMTLPVGMAVMRITDKLRMPQALGVGGAVAGALAVALFLRSGGGTEGPTRTNYAGFKESDAPTFLALPEGIPQPEVISPLSEYVAARTTPDDRLLLQTRIQAEPKILGAAWQREVIGNTYPDQHDPAQFLRNRLWGKRISEWTPDDLRDALDRWGVSVAMLYTKDAVDLFTKTLGSPGEEVGLYRVYRISEQPSRFVQGRGNVLASVNRIELSELEPVEGGIVLRYRFHPAWEAVPEVKLRRFAVPESSAGFLLLENPPPDVVLHFRPWRMLRARWPQEAEGLR